MAETDYSSMTDEELMGIVNRGARSGQNQPGQGPRVSDMLDEELLATIGQKVGAYDTAVDVGKSLGSGAVRGTMSLADLPQDLTSMIVGGVEKLTGRDIPESVERSIMLGAPGGFGRMLTGKSATEAATEYMPSVMGYKPKTTEGRYGRTVGEFAPGAAAVALTGGGGLFPILARTGLQSVIPGVSSEYAGQLAKEYFPTSKWAEPTARLAGAMLGGIGANSFENIVRGTVSPGGGAAVDDLAHAARLREADVPVSAGLATKSPKVLSIEANNPRLQSVYNLSDNSPQYQALTTAALREAGLTDEMIASLAAKKAADPTIIGSPALANKFVMDELYAANGQMFDDALSGLGIIPLRRLSDPIYKAAKKANAPGAVDEVVELLGNAARTGTTVPARELHRLRSELGKDLSSLDGSRAEAAAMARDAIDDLIDNAAAASNTPERLAMLDEARRRHQAILVMQNAVNTASVRGGVNGIVTPKDLASALQRVYGRKKVVTGNVNRMGDLAESGMNTLGTLGKSTASGWRSAIPFSELLLGGGGALGMLQGAAMYGLPLKFAALPAALTAGAAGIDATRRIALRQLEKYAHTKPVQTYLANQLMDPTTGVSGSGAAIRAGASGYPSYDTREGRKAGGRVGMPHEAAADQLVMAAERAKKGISKGTESLLDMSDNHIAHALEVANRSI